FSGGMDSLAGAVGELSAGRRVVLVSHTSAPQIQRRQTYLASELKGRFPGHVLHVPGLVRRKDAGEASTEETQQTRTFLFGALAAAVASFFRRESIRFYENGVVSLNLPIAAQIVGTMATRTTHPQSLFLLAQFLRSVSGKGFSVENPFAWKTKTEVATLLGQTSHADLVAETVSCSHIRALTTQHTHCGLCSQCLDRRFATLAAHLANYDPEEMYATNLLTGERNGTEEQTMAESFVRAARECRRLTPEAFALKLGGERGGAALGFPEKTPDKVAGEVHRLHKRHGDAVHSVLTKGVRRYASELAEKSLPAT